MDVVDIPPKLYNFSFLPQNVITLILEHLPFDDFQNAVQVCKSWYTASYDRNIIKRIRLLIDNDIETENIVRPFNKLELNKIDFNTFNYQEFFDTFGAYIEEIEFDRCAVQFSQLMECFSYLTALHTFQIYDNSKTFRVAGKNLDKLPYTEISENLARVKTLDIYCFFSTVDGAEIFLKYCKNIENLVWTSHQFEEPNYTCIINYLRAGNENGTLENLKKFHFYGINRDLSEDLFRNLAELNNLPNLRSLRLQYISSGYYDENFTKFCQNFNQLEYLEIGDVNSQQLADICEYMTELKCLRLRWTTATNLSDIGKLRRLEQLQVDRIEDPDDSDGQEIADMLDAKFDNLRELQLNRTHPNILVQLAENYSKLEVLRLHCLMTNDLVPLFEHLRSLKNLQLTFMDPITENPSLLEGNEEFNITRLTELEALTFSSYAPGMTPELMQQLPKLKAIHQADDPYYLPLRSTNLDDATEEELLAVEIDKEATTESIGDVAELNNEIIKPPELGIDDELGTENPELEINENTSEENTDETTVQQSDDNTADE